MFSLFKKIKDNLIPITNDNKSIQPELQDAKAQFNLGVMYENGLEVTHDYKEAFKWFSLSAKQGCADAQNNLGVMFEHGLGVIQDYAQAMHYRFCRARPSSSVMPPKTAPLHGSCATPSPPPASKSGMTKTNSGAATPGTKRSAAKSATATTSSP